MIKNIQQKANSIDKKYLIGGAIAIGLAAAGIIFYLKTRKASTTPDTPQDNFLTNLEDKKIEKILEEQSQQKAFIRIVNSLKKILPQDGTIGFDAVKQIYKAQYQLSKTQYKEITIKNREERRKKLDSFQQYFNIVSEYEKQRLAIHDKHLYAILAHFRINQTEWIELTNEAGIQFPDEWNDYIVDVDEQELNSLRNQDKPVLKLSVLKEISQFKIKKLKEMSQELKKAYQALEDADLYDTVEKWIRDTVYMEYKVEQEDFNFSIKNLSEKENQSLELLEEEVRQIMESLIMPGDENDDV